MFFGYEESDQRYVCLVDIFKELSVIFVTKNLKFKQVFVVGYFSLYDAE